MEGLVEWSEEWRDVCTGMDEKRQTPAPSLAAASSDRVNALSCPTGPALV